MDVSSQRLAVAKLENPPPRVEAQGDLLRQKKDPEHQTMIWVVVFQYFVFFTPYLGKVSNLTHIFQTGWNHQPDDGLKSLRDHGFQHVEKL